MLDPRWARVQENSCVVLGDVGRESSEYSAAHLVSNVSLALVPEVRSESLGLSDPLPHQGFSVSPAQFRLWSRLSVSCSVLYLILIHSSRNSGVCQCSRRKRERDVTLSIQYAVASADPARKSAGIVQRKGPRGGQNSAEDSSRKEAEQR